MSRIANRAKLGQMIIVPVLVEPCDWSEYPVLADRQMVPGAMPLIDFTESDPKWAKVKSEILDGLKTQIKRIRAAQSAPKNFPSESTQRHAQPVSAVFTAEPRLTAQAAFARPAAHTNEHSKSSWRNVPRWIWVLGPVLLIAFFVFVRLLAPHSQPVPSSIAVPSAAPQPTQPASSAAAGPNLAATQPPIPHPAAQSPAVQLAPAAKDTNPIAMKQQADALFNQNRFAQAEQLYFQLCFTGNGPSCNRSGYMYQNGLGVQANPKEAANLYVLACNANFPNGCSNLGNLYAQGLGVPKNLTLARQYLTKGCNAGNPFGCDKLRQLQ